MVGYANAVHSCAEPEDMNIRALYMIWHRKISGVIADIYELQRSALCRVAVNSRLSRGSCQRTSNCSHSRAAASHR